MVGSPPPALSETSDGPTSAAACSIAPATRERCSRSVPGADVHVQPGDGKPVAPGSIQAVADLGVPDAVFGMVAAGVGFAAVSVAEAGVDPQGDGPARGAAAELIDHLRRAAVDVDVVFDAEIERLGVEDVGRIDDRRRARRRAKSRRQSAADFARADGIDPRAFAAHEVQDGEIRARLLGIAHHVERRQVGDLLPDHGGVVNEGRRAEPPSKLDDRHAGDRCRKGRTSIFIYCVGIIRHFPHRGSGLPRGTRQVFRIGGADIPVCPYSLHSSDYGRQECLPHLSSSV